jgi:DNA gyrase/topoisomerase IV subunit B
MLEQGRVFRFMTPILVAYNSKDEIVKFFFTFDEYHEFLKQTPESELKKLKFDYKKGLGSLEESEWQYLFNNYDFEKLLMPLKVIDESDLEALDAWMNEDKDYRKEAIKKGIETFTLDVV